MKLLEKTILLKIEKKKSGSRQESTHFSTAAEVDKTGLLHFLAIPQRCALVRQEVPQPLLLQMDYCAQNVYTLRRHKWSIQAIRNSANNSSMQRRGHGRTNTKQTRGERERERKRAIADNRIQESK